jgi:hypothetical protein
LKARESDTVESPQTKTATIAKLQQADTACCHLHDFAAEVRITTVVYRKITAVPAND